MSIKNLLLILPFILILSGCTSTSSQVPSNDNKNDQQQSDKAPRYNDAVNDVVDLREDLNGYDLGI